MAYQSSKKTTSKSNEAFRQLKSDLSAGTLGCAYLFYGEESYLREYYLGELRKKLRKALVPAGFEEFNYHRVEGKDLSVQALSEMAEAMPMLSERTLIVATDFDLFKLGEEQREKLIAFLNDIPPYCCVVFVYDTIEYKPNRTYKKLWKALSDHVQQVEFQAADTSDLIAWIARRFRALGKDIDRQTAEHLIFTCGGLMTGLVPEITKIGTYAKGKSITRQDIDAVAEPVLDARIFDMTNHISARDYNKAAAVLGDLLRMQTEPIVILGAIGKELRRLYTARMALDSGKDRFWLMDLWQMRSDYPARLLLQAARRVDHAWCKRSLAACQLLDRRMKSEKNIDREGELVRFVMELAEQ